MRSLYLLTVIGCVALLGCSSYDHREKIASAVLYTEKGSIDPKAFSGALMEKFSSTNSPPSSLDAFVVSLGGKCYPGKNPNESLVCSIPQTATFCVESTIQITASLSAGAIASIKAQQANRGC
jgi:hypothetical protein